MPSNAEKDRENLLTRDRQSLLTIARQSFMVAGMKHEEALHWYRQDRFAAQDVTRATGLSERSQRELAKLGVLEPIQQANPKAPRLMNSVMLKRAAIIAPLNKAGLSLGVAGRIVYAAMMLEDLVFDIVDPWDIYYDAATEFEPATGLFQPRALPHSRDTWFAPEHMPASAEADFYLAVVNSRFVMLGTDNPNAAYGELTPDLADFLWWENAMYDHIRERGRDGILELSIKGVGDHSPAPFGSFDNAADPKTLTFRTKAADNADEAAASHALNHPVSILKLNASLALRVALRRLLFIDGAPET